MDKFSRRMTLICSAIVFVVAAALYLFSKESYYLPFWFLLLVFFTLALIVLSIPKYAKVDDQNLEIHCIVELTRIHINDIESIRRIDKSDIKNSFPIFGSYGFGGYFGYYFNPQTWNIFKIYVNNWENLVAVTDIYEQTYVINFEDPDRLITHINTIIEQNTQNDEDESQDTSQTNPKNNA